MDNDEIKKILFNQTKLQILGFEDGVFDNSYLYAWSWGVYPLYTDSSDYHSLFKNEFDVTYDMINYIVKYLDERYQQNEAITAYEFENYLNKKEEFKTGVKNVRSTSLRVMRYLYLADFYTSGEHDFWELFLKEFQYPSELRGVNRKFELSEIYV